MKRSKVIFGLVVAILVGSFSVARAQVKANYQNNLIEVGPDNVSGRARSVLVATTPDNQKMYFAGSVAGGLFSMQTVITDAPGWIYHPYFENGKEISLPITDLLQASDGKIYIATGEGYLKHNNNNDMFAPKGRGLYRYNIADSSFELIAVTNPNQNADFSYINRIEAVTIDGITYFYAGTTEGLYRWKITSDADWNNPQKIFNGAVQDIEMLAGQDIAFFTSGANLYRIGSIKNESAPVDMTGSLANQDGKASRIEIAAVYAEKLYLYALVTRDNGLFGGVYLTNDQQNWDVLSSETVAPMNGNNTGWHNSSLAVDPTNCKRIFIGGATLWVGQGFVEHSQYLWNKVSYSEDELNMGNYMGTVYTNRQFLHSGIHKIVCYYDEDSDDFIYLMATDGGVFLTDPSVSYFTPLMKGFNTVQYNHIAVSPDGSLIGGAVDNACPFIQSRHAHYNGTPNNTWYDNGSTMNHLASIIWTGNGAGVAASGFQQLQPMSRRGIFVSANGGMFGRSYADYTDYTNTQTWTSMRPFSTNIIAGSTAIPDVVLWETTNNTQWLDSITFTLDTLGVIYRNGDTMRLTGDFQVQSGDYVMVPSPAHFNYPFRYSFDHNFTAKDEMEHSTRCPIANRLFVTSKDNVGRSQVMMLTIPTDYRKVWDENETDLTKNLNWVQVLCIPYTTQTITKIAVSGDADAIFAAAQDDTTKENYILRVKGLSRGNVNHITTLNNNLSFLLNNRRISDYDTIFLNDSIYRFDRPVTSMFFDKGTNKLIVTLGDTLSSMGNILVINNAIDSSYTVEEKVVSLASENMTKASPVYSLLVEATTGDVFAGTENGVFKATAASFASASPVWNTYGAFDGVPVTSIIQQTDTLKTQRIDLHSGINTDHYIFAKTKYPYAIYFGTYGRGIFLDMTYVTDTVNEVADPEDFNGIHNVSTAKADIQVYPNPASSVANVELTIAEDAYVTVNVYDVYGKKVKSINKGMVAQGRMTQQIELANMPAGIYLVNVTVGKEVYATKLIVR